MKTAAQWILFAAAGAFVTGCGLIKTKDIDQASVDAVHKVAVVAYTADMPASASIMGTSGSAIPQNSDQADAILASLQKSLSANMNWQVVDTKTMVTNEGYKAAYEKTMKGWQNKMLPGQGINRFEVADVMDYDGARLLDVAGRDKLIDDLHVDAIVAAWVTTRLNGTTIAGFGARHPQTSVTIFVYKKGEPKAIWFQSFKGKEATESVGATAFTNQEKTADLALESANDAFSQIRTR